MKKQRRVFVQVALETTGLDPGIPSAAGRQQQQRRDEAKFQLHWSTEPEIDQGTSKPRFVNVRPVRFGAHTHTHTHGPGPLFFLLSICQREEEDKAGSRAIQSKARRPGFFLSSFSFLYSVTPRMYMHAYVYFCINIKRIYFSFIKHAHPRLFKHCPVFVSIRPVS